MTSADAIHVMGTLAAVVMLHKPGGWPIDAVTDSFIWFSVIKLNGHWLGMGMASRKSPAGIESEQSKKESQRKESWNLLRTVNSKRSMVNEIANELFCFVCFIWNSLSQIPGIVRSVFQLDFIPPSNFSEQKLFFLAEFRRTRSVEICSVWHVSSVCSFFIKVCVVQCNVSNNLWARQSCVLRLVGCLGCETYGVAIIIHLLSRQPSWMLRTVLSAFLAHRDVILGT